MKIQVHEILLTMRVAKELLRNSTEVSKKLEALLSGEVASLFKNSCLTVNQLSTHLDITPEEVKSLLSVVRKN